FCPPTRRGEEHGRLRMDQPNHLEDLVQVAERALEPSEVPSPSPTKPGPPAVGAVDSHTVRAQDDRGLGEPCCMGRDAVKEDNDCRRPIPLADPPEVVESDAVARLQELTYSRRGHGNESFGTVSCPAHPSVLPASRTVVNGASRPSAS